MSTANCAEELDFRLIFEEDGRQTTGTSYFSCGREFVCDFTTASRKPETERAAQEVNVTIKAPTVNVNLTGPM